MVHCVARGRFATRSYRLLPPMDTVFLQEAGGNFQEGLLAEEGKKVNVEPSHVPFDILRVALTFGDDFVFAAELVGGFLEALAAHDFTGSVLAL